MAKPVNGRLPNPMERTSFATFWRRAGSNQRRPQHRPPRDRGGTATDRFLSNETDAFAAAEAVDLESCPRTAVASLLLLDRQAQRLLVLETNRKDGVNVTRLRALDGSNQEAFLKFWRQSRVKPIEGARYTGG